MSLFPAPKRLLRGTVDRLCIGGVLPIVVLLAAAGGAFGQGEDARWNKLEATPESRAYKEAMSAGGAFDAKAREFFEKAALPQLALDANRSTIERVRKRMREFLLGDIANEKSAEEASKACLSFMESLAGKDEADPVVRVNAMLLIGELQGRDRKPFQPAATVLAQAVSDAKLSKAVRIAACVGMARHVEATKGLVDEQQRMATVATPAILAVLKEPTPPGAAVENDWLASRCLSMLPLLGPVTPEMTAAVVQILGDSSRSINLRVRAAAVLAAVAQPDSQVDAVAVIKAIDELARVSLDRDRAAGDRLQLDRQASDATGQSARSNAVAGQPPVEPLLPSEVCRRAAWRLDVLADSILTADSKRGLALLDGEPSPGSQRLSQRLRRAAMDLDAAPDETTLRQALKSLAPEASADEGAEEKPAAGGDGR